MINSGTNNPIELTPVVIHAGEEFNRENATLDDDCERAIDHVEFFGYWLWVVSNNKVGKPISSFKQEMPKLQNTRINATEILSWDLPIRRRMPNHRHRIQLMFCASLRKAFTAKMKVLKRQIS